MEPIEKSGESLNVTTTTSDDEAARWESARAGDPTAFAAIFDLHRGMFEAIGGTSGAPRRKTTPESGLPSTQPVP